MTARTKRTSTEPARASLPAMLLPDQQRIAGALEVVNLWRTVCDLRRDPRDPRAQQIVMSLFVACALKSGWSDRGDQPLARREGFVRALVNLLYHAAAGDVPVIDEWDPLGEAMPWPKCLSYLE